jgi:Flp pilus assembly protein CpaB
LKRSNRLILLIGVFLAVVAFGGILLLTSQQPSIGGPNEQPTTAKVVYTTRDIILGTKITADMIAPKEIALAQKAPDAFVDTGLVVGKKVRRDVVQGTQLTAEDFAANGQIGTIDVPKGLRAMTVQVDQVSGAGSVIATGDYVDLVVGITGDHFPVITVNPTDQSIQPVAGLNATSVKVLLQGIQVLGTLLPPPTAAQQQQQAQPGASGAPSQGQQTSLNGQQEIVMLAVTPQQAEVIKYAQLDGSVTLVLRSPDDFRDANGAAVIPPTDPTSGVILKTLVDQYGVLPPQLVETVLPARVRNQ